MTYPHKQSSASFTVSGGRYWDLLTAPRYEPVERNHDGYRFHGHRFPIKGGISHIEMMRRLLRAELLRPSPLAKLLPK